MVSDLQLLRDYASKGSEEAYAELVNRYVGLVYSAALRQVRSPHLAEEISQSVFVELAQSVAKLREDTVLSAWLYQVTRHKAIDLIRKETRRQEREQIAVHMAETNDES